MIQKSENNSVWIILDKERTRTMLILIAKGNAWWILMAAPNRELEPINLRLLKSDLAAAWADVSHALRGFYELADILIVLEEVVLKSRNSLGN